MNNKFNSSIDFNVPARDLKEIAQRLVSVDSFLEFRAMKKGFQRFLMIRFF